MKICWTLAIGLMAGGALFGADQEIELRGVVVGASTTKLSLVDKSNDTTRWVEVGQSFAGFSVKHYDPATETATLAQDGKEIRLRISTSKIPEASAEIPEAVAETIRDNLRQIAAAAREYFQENEKNEVRFTELVSPNKYLKQLNPVAGEDYSTLQLKETDFFPSGPKALSVTTRSGVRVTVDSPLLDTTFISKPLPSETYIVSPGETGAKIAARNNLTMQQLQALNPDVQWTQLKVGQTLKVK